MSSGGSQKATRVLQKMLSFMEKSRTDDMQERDTLDSFNELNENMREDRHKEVVDVFIQATKAKRKAEKDMAKEAKKREREAKKVEKETSKDTGGKGAAKDAADAAKKAKDAADAAKKAKDAADAAKKAKDAAEAKRIKDAADAKKAADTAKKQESVPKNKSAEKVKETKSEVPTAAPAPATEAAKTAAKVGAGVTAVVGATEVVARIKKKEGFQAKAYHDPKRDKDGRIVEDRYSVGYGHQITPQEVKQGFIKSGDINIPVSGILGKDTVITEKDASVLVNQDFQKYDRAARKITNFDKLGPDAQMAFLDMTYNMGEGWFSPEKWPKLHQALTNLDMYAAADSITNSLYYKQTGKRAVDNVQLIRKSSNIKAIEPDVKSPGTAINNLSSENADMKKDMSQGSSGGSTVIVQNNNTTQAKTNIQRTAPQEQLNPTMR
jgi:GH24 family phage-related lysozyme (muramidase)